MFQPLLSKLSKYFRQMNLCYCNHKLAKIFRHLYSFQHLDKGLSHQNEETKKKIPFIKMADTQKYF